MMRIQHPFISELMMDIDRGKIVPLTSIKNIESILAEFVKEYPDYVSMLKDLEEWHYIELL